MGGEQKEEEESMGIERSLVGGSMLLVVVALLLAQNRATGSGIDGNANLNRTCFPKEFIFGTAASAYQVAIASIYP